jgi:mannose-6-phosphate isomerase-like protein (cupin superfamily)
MNIKKLLEQINDEVNESKSKGFNTNIENDTIKNNNFRKVLFTANNMQLVLMSLKPNEDIGEEIHEKVDQFFRIDEGSGEAIINNHKYKLENGSAIIVPAGSKHNVIAGDEGIKLYTIYSPPNHKDGVIHKTKEDAGEDEDDIPEENKK